jgi:exonuclease SbcC
MRLHHLEMTAFGPFADTVEVDFDELASSGLFLLTGATGAGKSSVLDGVCFALYGDVPGDRATAKRLRSDQAPPERIPRVSLEVTLAGRRFRLDRSPAWASVSPLAQALAWPLAQEAERLSAPETGCLWAMELAYWLAPA